MSLSPTSFATLRVVIDGPPSPDTPVRWCGIEPSGQLQHGSGTVAQWPHAAAIELLVPATRYSQYLLALPAQSMQKLRALLPHALEERVLSDTSALHLAAGPAANAETRVVATDRNWLRGWAGLLANTQHRPRAAYAISDLVEPADETSRAVMDGGVMLVQHDEVAWFDDAQVATAWMADRPVQDLAWPDLCGDPARVDAINLLQGELSPKVRVPVDVLRLRRAGILLAAVVLVALVSALISWWSLRSDVASLQRELRQTFAAAFPGVPIVDPVLQLQSQLHSSGADRGNNSTGDLTAMLQKLDGIGPLSLKRLRYDAGQLQIDVATADVAAVQQKLTSAGLKADAQAGAGGVTTLRLGGAAQ
ncbi:type II secretion system protein GspL [Amantichitinum ursilacus]|uniref:GspL-like protein n=1 Tax=Amantichitinum ursilacus TaxID=857265 RepID=A0A0N0GPI9_9NEIS|nr:type II secretion system protein GspL [Amantichitinum ursilacus]KPC53853.1 GspL-like protein [Amantichitinum ursilacus]